MAERRRPQFGPAGRKLYDEVVAGVEAGWQLDVRDFSYLDQAARLADKAAALEQALEGQPLVVSGSRGQVSVHPAVGELRGHRVAIAALIAKVEVSAPRKRTWDNKAAGQLADARRARWRG